VRLIMNRNEIKRLIKEIKDLNRLQKFNFNSRSGYATKVYS